MYLGLVMGTVMQEEGTIEAPVEQHLAIPGKMRIGKNGKQSVTHFKVIERLRGFTWMEFGLETGRTHQIRVHMKHLEHPLVCDPLYGSAEPVLLSSFKKKFKLSKDASIEKPLLDRLALHASSILLKGMDGRELILKAALSKDLQVAMIQMRKFAKG
jgi:23S rRNA pseudouridine955/2504/2580 synthase/23S rRNA pseudouridine1911/1915/1917 synthase